MPSRRTRQNRARARRAQQAQELPIVEARPVSNTQEPIPVVMGEVLQAEPVVAEPEPEPERTPAPPEIIHELLRRLNDAGANPENVSQHVQEILSQMSNERGENISFEFSQPNPESGEDIPLYRVDAGVKIYEVGPNIAEQVLTKLGEPSPEPFRMAIPEGEMPWGVIMENWWKCASAITGTNPLNKKFKLAMVYEKFPVKLQCCDVKDHWTLPGGGLICGGLCFTDNRIAGRPSMVCSANGAWCETDISWWDARRYNTLEQYIASVQGCFIQLTHCGHLITSITNSMSALFNSIVSGHFSEPALTGVALSEYCGAIEDGCLTDHFGAEWLRFWGVYWCVETNKLSERENEWCGGRLLPIPDKEAYDLYEKNKGRFRNARDMIDYYLPAEGGGKKKAALGIKMATFMKVRGILEKAEGKPIMKHAFDRGVLSNFKEFKRIPKHLLYDNGVPKEVGHFDRSSRAWKIVNCIPPEEVIIN